MWRIYTPELRRHRHAYTNTTRVCVFVCVCVVCGIAYAGKTEKETRKSRCEIWQRQIAASATRRNERRRRYLASYRVVGVSEHRLTCRFENSRVVLRESVLCHISPSARTSHPIIFVPRLRKQFVVFTRALPCIASRRACRFTFWAKNPSHENTHLWIHREFTGVTLQRADPPWCETSVMFAASIARKKGLKQTQPVRKRLRAALLRDKRPRNRNLSY